MQKQRVLAIGGASTALLALGALALGGVMATRANLDGAAFAGLAALFLVGGALGFVAWVVGMMRAARLREWEWFVGVLLLGPLGVLLYGALGAPEPAMQ